MTIANRTKIQEKKNTKYNDNDKWARWLSLSLSIDTTWAWYFIYLSYKWKNKTVTVLISIIFLISSTTTKIITGSHQIL